MKITLLQLKWKFTESKLHLHCHDSVFVKMQTRIIHSSALNLIFPAIKDSASLAPERSCSQVHAISHEITQMWIMAQNNNRASNLNNRILIACHNSVHHQINIWAREEAQQAALVQSIHLNRFQGEKSEKEEKHTDIHQPEQNEDNGDMPLDKCTSIVERATQTSDHFL